MRRPLDRLLRIRALLEERSQLEFAKREGEMLRIGKGAERLERMAFAARVDACAALTSEEAADGWLTDIADAEILGWNSGRLGALARARQPAVEEARQELLARRVERRQVESLLSSAAEAEKEEQGRRDQKRLDEWFQNRSAKRKNSR